MLTGKHPISRPSRQLLEALLLRKAAQAIMLTGKHSISWPSRQLLEALLLRKTAQTTMLTGKHFKFFHSRKESVVDGFLGVSFAVEMHSLRLHISMKPDC